MKDGETIIKGKKGGQSGMAAVKEFINSSLKYDLKDKDASMRISALNRNYISARSCPKIYTTLGTIRDGRYRYKIKKGKI